MPYFLDAITSAPIKPNQGVKNKTAFHLTRETAKSWSAPLTKNVIKTDSHTGTKEQSGLITLRDK